MGVGLLILLSVGHENLFLSTQPEITYFKIAYKRYTNFSIETVAQYFKTIPDFSRRVTVNISKNADLLGQSYLFVQLPDIITSNHSILPQGIKKFAWNKKIGLSLIKYIDFEIDVVKIDIEGSEINVLENSTILKNSKFIILEWHFNPEYLFDFILKNLSNFEIIYDGGNTNYLLQNKNRI
jgi:hypothetical protein